jgi:hypothetical protein
VVKELEYITIPAKQGFAKDEFDMGKGYTYFRRDVFDAEIRYFVLKLQGNINEQMDLIDKYNINGLGFDNSFRAPPEVQEEEHSLAGSAISKLGSRLLMLDLWCFKNLKTLDILDLTPNLISLSLHCKLKTPYDFTKLPKLKDLSLWYSKPFASIFECTSVRKLKIFKMDDYAVENIQKLHRIEELCIRQSSLVNIDGLRALKNLEKLEFRHLPKLESISSIQECQEITELTFDGCKRVTDWDVIENFSKLKFLYMVNCGVLNDINFLKPLENLETVHIGAERKEFLDNNVRWLYEKPRMKMVSLPWRKDFDISLEEFWAGQSPERYPDVWKWDLS